MSVRMSGPEKNWKNYSLAYPERQAERTLRRTANFIVSSNIQFPQVMWGKKLGKDTLSDGNEKEEWQGEQDSSHWNPCDTITDEEVY